MLPPLPLSLREGPRVGHAPRLLGLGPKGPWTTLWNSSDERKRLGQRSRDSTFVFVLDKGSRSTSEATLVRGSIVIRVPDHPSLLSGSPRSRLE